MKVINILSKEYYKKLTKDDFLYITDILLDNVKVLVFISLLRKDTRNK